MMSRKNRLFIFSVTASSVKLQDSKKPSSATSLKKNQDKLRNVRKPYCAMRVKIKINTCGFRHILLRGRISVLIINRLWQKMLPLIILSVGSYLLKIAFISLYTNLLRHLYHHHTVFPYFPYCLCFYFKRGI